jgi:small-conductance mechanosensitive channel
MPKTTAEVTVQTPEIPPVSHSSPAPNPPPNPGAETVIQAAIQTGESAAEATQAATKAQETVSQAEALIAKAIAEIRAEVNPLSARLAAIEEELAEEPEQDTLTIQESAEDTDENVSVKTVEIAEPQKVKTSIQPAPEQPKSGGGFLRRMFLNR